MHSVPCTSPKSPDYAKQSPDSPPLIESQQRDPLLNFPWTAQLSAIFDGMYLQSSMHHLINDHYNKGTKTLDLSDHKLSEFPITPVLHSIHRTTSGLDIQTLNLSQNQLFGVIHGDHLPFSLKVVDLSNNDLFSFSVPLLSILPPGLEELHIQNNHFCDNGDFAWYLLPRNLKVLQMQGNAFMGRIVWNQLPQTLNTLIVSTNQASGSLLDKPDKWKIWRQTEREVMFIKNVKPYLVG